MMDKNPKVDNRRHREGGERLEEKQEGVEQGRIAAKASGKERGEEERRVRSAISGVAERRRKINSGVSSF